MGIWTGFSVQRWWELPNINLRFYGQFIQLYPVHVGHNLNKIITC